MMNLFAPPAAWFCWPSIPYSREPLKKGLAEEIAVSKGFSRINKLRLREKIIYFYSLSGNEALAHAIFYCYTYQ